MDLLNNRILKTEMVEWKKLIPFQPDNLKKTEPYKLQKLANSLCENGFSMNFYVWEKEGSIYIIDGHSRHEVLTLLETGAIYPKTPQGNEYSVTIPEKLSCSFLHLKNKTEAKKAVLIYNSKYKNIDSDILSEWVSDLNLDELQSQIEIPELNFDIDTPQELTNDTIDDAEKIKTNIKLGDLIEIGKHRLLCGDSTNEDDVKRLMDGKKADMVFTDPPYGVDYKGIKNDDRSGLENLLNLAFLNYSKYVKKGSSIYCFHSDKCADIFQKVFREYCHFSSMIIWVKESIVLSQTDYQSKHEPCMYGWFKDATHNWYSDRKQESVWVSKSIKEEGHTTPKPIDIINKAIINSSKIGDLVSDLFLGSGSTMVACQTLDRICYGMELEPLYCQVIINRMRKNFPELEIKINGKEYTE